MTRDTYIGGEGSRFRHGDAQGRSFYLPPNSASNAAWLMTLRYLLIQDWDLDQDGKPETLRLMYGVPRRWLEDGKEIRVARAPTAFGYVSCCLTSRLAAGYVEVEVSPPPRPAKTLVVRAPLPKGWRVKSVQINGTTASLLGGDAVEVLHRNGPILVRFNASPG
jgi:hypothetical protein